VPQRIGCRIASLLLGLILVIPGAAAATGRAQKLHRDALVFDAHVHLVTRQFYQGGSIAQRYPDGHVDLPRMREGGVDAFFLTLYVREEYYPGRYETRQLLRLIDLALRQIEENRDQIELALTAGDVRRITRQGKMAAVLDLEGSFDLDGDLGVLRSFYRLGLRVVQIAAHNWTSHYSDSCCAPSRWGGLNERGRALVREMNRLGMLINVSHASDETIRDVLAISTHPVVATHHGLRTFNDIPRNLPEELARQIAAKGGLIGVQIGNAFHNPRFYRWRTQQAGKSFWETREVEERVAGRSIEEIDDLLRPSFPFVGPQAPPELLLSVDDWLAVVDRLIEIAGEDHVILGTDWDGGLTPPRGIRDVRDLPLVTEAMLRRGYSAQRIRKILGENLLRVFGQVCGH